MSFFQAFTTHTRSGQERRSGQPVHHKHVPAADRRHSERRRYASAQETREYRFRQMEKEAGIGAYDFDCSNRRAYWSPELKALAGLPQDNSPVDLEQVDALIHPDDRERFIAHVHRLLASDHPIVFEDEWRLLRRDGAVRWIKDRGRIFFVGPQESPAKVVTGIIIDVTSSRPREGASLSSPSELAALMASALEAIIGTDADRRIVLFNPMAARMFRCLPSDTLGLPIERFVPWEYMEATRHRGRQLSGTGEPPSARDQSIICTGRRADGEEFPMEVSIAEVRDSGTGRMLLSIQDLSERQHYEAALKRLNDRVEDQLQQLQRSQEGIEALTRSNQELQHFALIATHDLQAPLRSIKNFAAMLQHELHGRLDGQTDTWLTYLQRSSQRLHSLLQDLLAYATIQTREHTFSPTDLREVVDDVVISLDAEIQGTGARVTRDKDLPIVNGDAAQLGQVLQNLIANGIKYHNDRRPRVHVSARWNSGEWIIMVRDNGIGIPQQELGAIFNLFRRLHSQNEFPGTGIGLAVCKRVVERHGGRIWVESTPGQGSVFSFTLPAMVR